LPFVRVMGMTSGSLASEAVCWGLGTLGAVEVEFGWNESSLLGYVNLFTILRTISSNGSDVKTPPCTYRARLSDQGH
jgi:hypothetical protein